MGTHSHSATGSTVLKLLRDPSDPEAWKTFVDRYGPKIYGWCQKWSVQKADAENVTQEVLTKLVARFRKDKSTYDPSKGSFRAWLKTVTRNALSDYREHQRRAGIGAGDSELIKILNNTEAPEELIKALTDAFDLEILDEAKARVRLQVTDRDWRIFHELAFGQRKAREVAQELVMKVAAVLMVKGRVQKKLQWEVRHLESGEEGPGKNKP